MKRFIELSLVFIVSWLIAYAVFWIGFTLKYAIYELSDFGRVAIKIAEYSLATIVAAGGTFIYAER